MPYTENHEWRVIYYQAIHNCGSIYQSIFICILPNHIYRRLRVLTIPLFDKVTSRFIVAKLIITL